MVAAGFAAVWSAMQGSAKASPTQKSKTGKVPTPMLKVSQLPGAGPWPTSDPFLFCVHHHDSYPAANAGMGPRASLAGRDLGQDFANIDGWNMYHGREIPGFPQHPHRGFETLTVVKQGLIDHSDSLGAKARYGAGDAQWLTAGDGIVHAEMFPLLNQESGNPTDFFQIWINLPAQHKRVAPYFRMFWNETIPRVQGQDAAGRKNEVRVVAGSYGSTPALNPPPNSWAADPHNEMAVWVITLQESAQWTLPTASAGISRSIYVVRGAGIHFGSRLIQAGHRIELETQAEIPISNAAESTELLLLQGRPIGEPLVQYGPFVMNTANEIQEAFADYSRTQFGGWKWADHGPVHGRDPKRFAQLIDGNFDEPPA